MCNFSFIEMLILKRKIYIDTNSNQINSRLATLWYNIELYIPRNARKETNFSYNILPSFILHNNVVKNIPKRMH